MDEQSAGLILREFAAHRATRTDPTKCWKWAAGAIRFPEAICPWCGGAMRSNRIWLVDERGKRLRGQVAIVDGKLVREDPQHPHVRHGGLCMGSATSVYHALFLAMSAEGAGAHSHWRNDYIDWKQRWKDWQVKVFDHACDGDGRSVDRKGKLVAE